MDFGTEEFWVSDRASKKEQGKDEVNRKQEMGVRKQQEEGKEGDRGRGREKGRVLNRERKESKKEQPPERRKQQTTLEPILSNLHIHSLCGDSPLNVPFLRWGSQGSGSQIISARPSSCNREAFLLGKQIPGSEEEGGKK